MIIVGVALRIDQMAAAQLPSGLLHRENVTIGVIGRRRVVTVGHYGAEIFIFGFFKPQMFEK
jgi:hypothetical protein